MDEQEGPLSPATLERARRQGAAADLIYVVELPGFTLAEQSVGVINDEGFGAVYTDGSRTVELRIDRGTGDGFLMNADPPTAPVTCEPDKAGWYRSGGGCHEYMTVRRDHVIRLSARLGDVDRAVLKAAALGARRVATK